MHGYRYTGTVGTTPRDTRTEAHVIDDLQGKKCHNVWQSLNGREQARWVSMAVVSRCRMTMVERHLAGSSVQTVESSFFSIGMRNGLGLLVGDGASIRTPEPLMTMMSMISFT
jgi:hypothetical protein